jgi:hypothetical protein
MFNDYDKIIISQEIILINLILATYEASSHNGHEPPSLAGDKWVQDWDWWAPQHDKPRV